MTQQDFSAILAPRQAAEHPAVDIVAPRGVSSGQSRDGAVLILLLGERDRAEAACQFADIIERDAQKRKRVASRAPVGLVVIDRRQQSIEVFAAPIGLRQIFWRAVDGNLRIASRAPLPNGAGQAEAAVQPDGLYRYLYFHTVPGPAAFSGAVSKLDGGHVLRWQRGGTTIERYWNPRFEDSSTPSPSDATAELRSLLDTSVSESLGGRQDVATFLSGGLDSSTVAGFAARHQPGIPTVSMGFDAAGYDEMSYARIVSSHFKTRPLEYYITPQDVVATLPALAAAFSEPFGNSSAAATYHCARIAKDNGIGLLLAGDGGDELFGGNDRYARQMTFERYWQLPRVVRSVLNPLVGITASITQRYPIGKVQSYLQQANVALPDRLQSYNFLHRHDPAEIFAKEILDAVDASSGLRDLRSEYHAPHTRSAINRMLFLDWKFTLHDNDLVKVNQMCDYAGVEVAYPMLHPDLIDFSLRMPSDWKVRRGELRWFYKRAMKGFLPDQVIQKTKHGFGLPFGVWTRTHEGLRRMSEDAIGSLSTRGFFRPDFLREALRLHREGHASYYGELVWILMVLELWLRVHAPNARL
jgi:asparagine synthase (glutamine-hydrolysing)